MATSTLPFPEKPHQPKAFTFPIRSFGKKQVVQRSFKPTWFDKWNWIHYNEALDATFCHVCARAEEEGKLKANSKDLLFIQKDSPTGRMPQKDFVDMNRVSAIRMQYR